MHNCISNGVHARAKISLAFYIKIAYITSNVGAPRQYFEHFE